MMQYWWFLVPGPILICGAAIGVYIYRHFNTKKMQKLLDRLSSDLGKTDILMSWMDCSRGHFLSEADHVRVELVVPAPGQKNLAAAADRSVAAGRRILLDNLSVFDDVITQRQRQRLTELLDSGIRVDSDGISCWDDFSCSQLPGSVKKRLEKRIGDLREVRDILDIDILASSTLSSPQDLALPYQLRVKRLLRMCRYYPEHPSTREACIDRLQSGHPEERLIAASQLDRNCLLPGEIASNSIPLDVWLAAFEWLLQKHPDRCLDTVDAAASPKTNVQSHELLEHLLQLAQSGRGEIAREPKFALLLQRAATGIVTESRALITVVDLLGGLGAGGVPALGALLLAEYRLKDLDSEPLKQKIARALAQTGSASAMGPLRQRMNSIYVTPQLWTVCEKAVKGLQQIKTSLQGGLAVVDVAEAGSLAVSEGNGGLALAQSGEKKDGGE